MQSYLLLLNLTYILMYIIFAISLVIKKDNRIGYLERIVTIFISIIIIVKLYNLYDLFSLSYLFKTLIIVIIYTFLAISLYIFDNSDRKMVRLIIALMLFIDFFKTTIYTYLIN